MCVHICATYVCDNMWTICIQQYTVALPCSRKCFYKKVSATHAVSLFINHIIATRIGQMFIVQEHGSEKGCLRT